MAIYAILGLKGGAAKTTTAIHLAACAAVDRRHHVTVIDADEERSASRWAEHAADLPFAVVIGERNRLAQQARALEREGSVFIDTPPNNREILTRAGMLATHAIVPVAPAGLDIDRLRPTLELLRDVEATRGELNVAILLCRWDDRTTLAREAVEALRGYPVLGARIRQLTRYAQSFGTSPAYLDEYAAAWSEIRG